MCPNVDDVSVCESSFTRALLDREIMLSCLADAADRSGAAEFAADGPARRLIQIRLETTRMRCAAARQREEARGLRKVPRRPQEEPGELRSTRRKLINDFAGMTTMLELSRSDLAIARARAEDLRSESLALQAEARQIRRRIRSRGGQ